ncbi:Mrh transcription modulator under heat shock [Escherichia phage vB_EcoM_005]|uniref:Uncharacterized protein n=1 Tax=Escherichia phage vB_EcoM_005 TaxID=2500761 RepID=A0A3T0IM00_9CAUD|nr:Mrh transcription modulator under heat shock [Escherichia phage vB_EcoM_005]AZV01094.1 hypothetical protein vBEcoM005_207 [Escherichia phage vB_EcoM_005]
MKVYELEFFVRDSARQTRPYDATPCLILVDNGTNSITQLETRLKDICYRYPADPYTEGTMDLFYKDTDRMSNERLKGRTYLISATEDLTEVERQIWKHFDIGLRFTMTEDAIFDAKVRARMYEYGPIGGY